jgi:uncharacterized membrane protein YdcZ (DUF606 family)
MYQTETIILAPLLGAVSMIGLIITGQMLAAILAGYIGKSKDLDEAIAKFTNAYAGQIERDYDLPVAVACQECI